MKRLLAIGVAFALGTASAESFLIDDRDEFTDERKLSIAILADDSGLEDMVFGPKAIGWMCDPLERLGRSVSMVVKPELMLHMESRVTVKLRFDDKESHERKFLWINETALDRNETAARWLHEALGAKRLIVKVGDTGTMRFDLETAQADLEEFKTRCDAWRDGGR